MNSNHRRIVLGAAVAVVAMTHLSSASAMGRSTTPMTGDRTLRAELVGSPTDAATKSQVEALRQELAEIRAQLAMMQRVASND